MSPVVSGEVLTGEEDTDSAYGLKFERNLGQNRKTVLCSILVQLKC